MAWWSVVRERPLTEHKWVDEGSYGGGWDEFCGLKLWLCGILVGADGFGVKRRGYLWEEEMRQDTDVSNQVGPYSF